MPRNRDVVFGTVRTIEDRIRKIKEMIEHGLKDVDVRKFALSVTHGCEARDDLCELASVFNFVQKNIRYAGDIAGTDTYQSPQRTLEFRSGDCLPMSALVLRNDYELVPLSDLKPGDRIMGDGDWTEVVDRWLTDEKPLLDFELNNGSVLRCSEDHRVFVYDQDGNIIEIRARDVAVGARLAQPSAIRCADTSWFARKTARSIAPDDLAWLTGVHVADGWTEEHRFAISGRDGMAKEAQKARVAEIMAKAGVSTRWHERYIAVNDAELTRFMSLCGKGAPQKHLPSLALTQIEVEAALEGLNADSGVATSGTRVFSTTSALLALQLRVLYRMLGQPTHIRRVDRHGGLGENPIYRITVRSRETDSLRERNAVRRGAKVVSVSEADPELCMDLTTSSGKFWLPESDVLVHNCDDHVSLNGCLIVQNGFGMIARVTSEDGIDWGHIYCVALYPKFRPNAGIALDTTLPGGILGQEPSRIVKYKDFRLY